jgi:hypothetical protein
MSKMDLSKLKTLLQETMVTLAQGGSISSASVIDAVRKRNPDDVRLVAEELENMAMHVLFSRIAALKPKDERQTELFANYSGIHQFITIEVPGYNRTEPQWKLLSKATLREVGAWLRRDRKRPITRRVRERGMATMLRDLSKAAKGRQDITVEAALALKFAQDRKKRA